MSESIADNFLKDFATKLWKEHGSHVTQVAVVLPSNRAIVYLKRYLFEAAGKSVMAPTCLLLPAFTKRLVQLTTEEKLGQILLLYESYTQVAEEAEPFELFVKWGATALDDFNDIESSLANPELVFRNLKEIKDIEQWSFGETHLSEAQHDFLDFWLQLGNVYHAFVALQEETKRYSFARLNRLIAEEKVIAEIPTEFEHVYFVGMTSFSKAEEKWIKRFAKSGRIHFSFDADAYYVNNPIHEAGHFFRRWEREVGPFPKSTCFEDADREIIISKVVTPLASAFAAANLVEQLSVEERAETAVILVQPQLLRPFLNALSIDSPLNVALGYPIDQTNVFRTTKSLIRIWSRLAKDTKKGIYHKDFAQWIVQPECEVLLSQKVRFALQRTIVKRRFVYIRQAEFEKLAIDTQVDQSLTAIAALFDTTEFTLESLLIRLSAWLLELENSTFLDELNREAVLRMQSVVSRIRFQMNRTPWLNSPQVLEIIFQHYAALETIAFTGEPLKGLQVLSTVETRGVDFQRVIVVGANDDAFPGNGLPNSLIPYDLRTAFELPSMEDREGAFAYTFYRLLQRSKQVQLIYHTISADYKLTEPSRYILQLELELATFNNRTSIRYEDFGHEAVVVKKEEDFIPQDNFSKSRLKQLLEGGLSPSALNKFIQCPLDFYYRYIISLGELNEMEESMEASTFGSVVHYVLESLYTPFEGKELDSATIKTFYPQVDSLLDEAIMKNYASGELEGFDILAKGVAREMILRTLKLDEEEQKNNETANKRRTVHGIETTLTASIEHGFSNDLQQLVLKGKSDRIDRIGNEIRIIDFKTGKVDAHSVKLDDDSSKWFTDKNAKLIQLMMYSYMWNKMGNKPEETKAVLLGLKQVSQGYVGIMRGKEEAVLSDADMKEFQNGLISLVEEMLTTETFKHNPNSTYCEYCRT
jgi:ATP-dependent helicase/nuclease subunit B